MRGEDTLTEQLFSIQRLEDLVPADRPLRPFRAIANAALIKMHALLAGMYEADIKGGRPSAPPEKLLRAMLLQVFFNVRSERQLMGQSRSNDTHACGTDPDARPYCKGDNASRLRYMSHTLADNRHGLIANAMVTIADGYAEREAAKRMIDDARQATENSAATITIGADKGYDAQEFAAACLAMNVVPHIAQNTSDRRSSVPEAIAATVGYAISQQKRKRIEQGFGWATTIGRMRQVMVRGIKRVDQMFVLTMAAYNLTRMRSLGQIRLHGA